MENKTELVQHLYIYFLSKFTGKKCYVTFNERYSKIIENFFKLLQKKYSLDQLDINWFFHYFLITFSFYFEKDLHTGNKIYLHWILGKKSYQKYVNLNKDQLYYINKFKREKNIRLSDFVKEYKILRIGLSEREETERKRFLNSIPGLRNCIESTTMYNNRSITCISCNNKKECKAILKNMYPKLYKERVNEQE